MIAPLATDTNSTENRNTDCCCSMSPPGSATPSVGAGCRASYDRKITTDRTAVISIASPRYLLRSLVGSGATIQANASALFEIGVQAQTQIAPPAAFDSIL
jgi:hypothetical protein